MRSVHVYVTSCAGNALNVIKSSCLNTSHLNYGGKQTVKGNLVYVRSDVGSSEKFSGPQSLLICHHFLVSIYKYCDECNLVILFI
jgi:hypothetical protein